MSDPNAHPSASWQPISRTSTHELVAEAIEEQILSGAVRAGEPLPAEKDLAAALGVSRPSAREAVRMLESLGVVETRSRAGASAQLLVAAQPGEALTRFLRMHVALASFPMADVVEARVMLERWSAALAASHHAPEHIAAIAAEAARMDHTDDDQVAFNDSDTAFHVAIARAGGNGLVEQMTVAVRESMRRPLLAAIGELGDWPSLRDRLRAEHRAILDAIVAGDAALAADLCERHIRSAARDLPGLHHLPVQS